MIYSFLKDSAGLSHVHVRVSEARVSNNLQIPKTYMTSKQQLELTKRLVVFHRRSWVLGLKRGFVIFDCYETLRSNT